MRLPKINIMPWWVKVGIVVAIIAVGIALVDKVIGNIKTKITHTHEDYLGLEKSEKQKSDSLKIFVRKTDSLFVKNFTLSEKVVSDSLMFKSINESNQRNLLKLSKQNEEYRKNGACFVYDREWFLGRKKIKEIPCDSLKNE